MENTLDLRYSEETFDFFFSVLNYVFKKEKNPSYKSSIYGLMDKIKGCHKWEFVERTFIIITLDINDFSIIHYCYESVLIDSVESRQNIFGNTSYFSVRYEEDKRRGGDGL